MDPCTSSIFDSFAPELQILGYNFAGAVTDQRIQEIAQVLQGKGVTNNPNKAVPLDLLVEYFQPQMPHPLDIDALTLALLTLGIEVGPTGREDEPQWTVGIDFNTERIQYDVIQTFVTNAKELELLTPEETQISFDPSKIFSLSKSIQKTTLESHSPISLRELLEHVQGFCEPVSFQELVVALCLLGYDISIIEQNKLRWTVNLQLEESRKSLELRTSIDQAYRLGIFRNEQVVINPEIMEKCCKIMRGSVEPNENALVTLRSLTDFIQPFDGTAIGEEVVAAAALILGHQPTYVNGEWGFNLELVGF